MLTGGITEMAGQLTSPDQLSPRLAATRLSSKCHVLGRRRPSTYDQPSTRLTAAPLSSNCHVRLGPTPRSGLVWLAIWPATELFTVAETHSAMATANVLGIF